MAKVSTEIELGSGNLAYTTSNDGNGVFDATTTPAITPHNGKTNAFIVAGNFDGATVKLQHKLNTASHGTQQFDIGPDTTLTANGGGLFTSPVSNIRVKVSNAAGSGPAFDVQVIIKPIIL